MAKGWRATQRGHQEWYNPAERPSLSPAGVTSPVSWSTNRHPLTSHLQRLHGSPATKPGAKAGCESGDKVSRLELKAQEL